MRGFMRGEWFCRVARWRRRLRGHGSRPAAPRLPVEATGYTPAERLEGRCLLSVSPIGPEFRVNTYTPGGQGTPAVAADAAGNSIVVWGRENPADGFLDVYAQRYDAAGERVGGEF